MLSEQVLTRVDRFIDVYGIHQPGVLPISILHLCQQRGFRVIYREDMGAIYGLAMVTGTTREILLNACATRQWQRFAAAHELGHILAAHQSNGVGFRATRVMHLRPEERDIEREATQIGARLLVPDWAIDEYETPDAIAAACDVPLDMVTVRLKYRNNGEWISDN